MIKVWLDSQAENMIDGLALRAHSVSPELWNGWVQPISTEEAFRTFISAWSANDPNGTWSSGITVEGDQLVYDDGENDPDVFPAIGTDDNGATLYDLSGWTWVQ